MNTSAHEAALRRLIANPENLACCRDSTDADPGGLLVTAQRHGIDVLVAAVQLGEPEVIECPSQRDALTRVERVAATLDALRTVELMRVLEALAKAEIEHLVFKGAALAHQIYAAPHLRPRADTDLLVREDDVGRAIAVLKRNGYVQTVCAVEPPIGAQTLLTHTGKRGVSHSIDLHWRPFQRSRYRQCFDVETLILGSVPLPQLSPWARCAPLPEALQLACVHLLAHHPNEYRLIWLIDIDKLARDLTSSDWATVERDVFARGIESECAAALQMAADLFDTPIHSARLIDARIAQKALKRTARQRNRWFQLWDDFLQLPSWALRVAFLRTTLFPSRAYMDAVYPNRGPLWWRHLRRALRLRHRHSNPRPIPR